MCIQFLEHFHLCGHSGPDLFRRNCSSQGCNPLPTPIRINWDSFCPSCCLKAQLPKTAKSACLNKLQYTMAKDVLKNYSEHLRIDHSEDSLFFWIDTDVNFLSRLDAPDSYLPAICDLWRALNSTIEDFQATGKGTRVFVERFHMQQERFLVQQVRQLILHKFILALTSPATVYKQEISSKLLRFPCTIAEDDVTQFHIFRLESRMELLEAVDPSSFQHSQLNCKMCESSLDTHNPVRMPCCSRIVGRECIKKDVLGQDPDDCPICPFCWSPLLEVTPLEEFMERTNVPNSEKPDFQSEEPWWLRVLQGNLYVVTRMRELTESDWCIESQDDGCTNVWKDSKMDELKRSILTKARRLQQSISARVITPMKELVSKKEDDEIQDPNPNGFNFEGQNSSWSLIGDMLGERLLKERSNWSPF